MERLIVNALVRNCNAIKSSAEERDAHRQNYNKGTRNVAKNRINIEEERNLIETRDVFESNWENGESYILIWRE